VVSLVLLLSLAPAVLTPPKVWRDTHNYHHAHNAKLVGSHIGSYPTLSVAIWNKLSPSDRRAYALARNGFTILFAYLTVFLIGMCVSPLRRDARRNRSAWAALGLHVALAALAFALGGAEGLLLGFLFPLNVAFVTGAYLFYAQHNFEGVKLRGRHEWEFTRAALEASSYMPMGPAMRWFTADIGYHHVHHLNSRIPFYRLAEAMDAIPELQHPGAGHQQLHRHQGQRSHALGQPAGRGDVRGVDDGTAQREQVASSEGRGQVDPGQLPQPQRGNDRGQ
jgi:omega-6 fatty acid desaturase (delta-12 desaturase)